MTSDYFVAIGGISIKSVDAGGHYIIYVEAGGRPIISGGHSIISVKAG